MYGSKVTQLLNDRIGTETEAVQGPNLTCAHSTVRLLLLRMRPWGLELFPMKDQIVILGVCFLLASDNPFIFGEGGMNSSVNYGSVFVRKLPRV